MIELFKAINAVMAEVGYVQKEGVNREQGYKFAGEAAILAALRPSLVKNGLMILPLRTDQCSTEDYQTAKGTIMHRTTLKCVYRIAHISGEYLDVEMPGVGVDAGDKDLNKALTVAFKYVWRQTFGMETGDDPDKASPEETTGKRQRQPSVNRPSAEPPDGMIGGDSDDLAPPLPATPPQRAASARNVAKPDGTAALVSVYVQRGGICKMGEKSKTPGKPYLRWYAVYGGEECAVNYYGEYTKAADALGTDTPETFTGEMRAQLGAPFKAGNSTHYTAEHIELPEPYGADLNKRVAAELQIDTRPLNPQTDAQTPGE